MQHQTGMTVTQAMPSTEEETKTQATPSPLMEEEASEAQTLDMLSIEMEREESKFAQAFEIVYHHPIVKGKFWKSFFAGLIGGQYKYKSEHPLTLNNGEPISNKVTSGWDTNIYNWAEFFFAFAIRLPKNLFKFVTEFVWVGIYLNLKPGSYLSYVPLVLARIGQTFTSPITAVSQTAEDTLKRIKERSDDPENSRSWVYEIPGILGTVLHVVLATCIATAYLILTATFLFSLLHYMGLGSVVMASVNFANYLGSIPFFAQLGSLFISLVAKVGAMVGLNFVTSGLLPAISMACTLLTVIVPVAVVRWLLRQHLDISSFIEKLMNRFRGDDGTVVEAESSLLLASQVDEAQSSQLYASKPVKITHAAPAGKSQPPLSQSVFGSTEKHFETSVLHPSYDIVPVTRITASKPIIIDPNKPIDVKILINRKGRNVDAYNLGNVDPNIILSLDGKTFTFRKNPLRKVEAKDDKASQSGSSTLSISSSLAATEEPKETVLSCQTIANTTKGKDSSLVISDGSPIKIQFLPTTTGSRDQGAVLALGDRCSLQLAATFDYVMTALSSLDKPSQPSMTASDTIAGSAASSADTITIMLGHGGEVKPVYLPVPDPDVLLQTSSDGGQFKLAGKLGHFNKVITPSEPKDPQASARP